MYSYWPKEDKSLANHIRNFKKLVAIVDYYGGEPFYNKRMAENELASNIEKGVIIKTTAEYKKLVIYHAKAVGLLRLVCSKQYGRLMMNICDQYSFKIDAYPKESHRSI